MHCATRLLPGMLLLSGAICAKADLVVSPGQVDFGVVAVSTTSEARAHTLRNSGDQALTVTAIAIYWLPSEAAFARVGGSCGEVPFNLAPQATCTIEHTFSPVRSQTYLQTNRITLAGGETVDFGLIGEGDVGRVVFDPMSLHFVPTPVGTSRQELTVELDNVRRVPVQVTGFTSTSVPTPSAFVRTGGTCGEPPFLLYEIGTCTLRYTFIPAQVGRSTMELAVHTSGGSGSSYLQLSGDGEPELSLFYSGFEAQAQTSIQ